jgi:hypothetical protein
MYTVKGSPVIDPHPVEGIQTSDGHFVLAGKGLEADYTHEAFAVKIDGTTGAQLWLWPPPQYAAGCSADCDPVSYANGGKWDNAASLAQLPNGGDVLIAGYREVGTYVAPDIEGVSTTYGVTHATVTRLNLATGVEVWTATLFGGITCPFLPDPDLPARMASCSALAASIDVGADGSVYLAGALNMTFGPRSFWGNDNINFHSAGSPTPGTANPFVAKFPAGAFASPSAPTDTDATWVREWGAPMTLSHVFVRTVHPMPNGDAIALLVQSEEFILANGLNLADEIVSHRLNGATGTDAWGPTPLGNGTLNSLMGPNDFSVSDDGSFLYYGGMIAHESGIGLIGFIAKASTSDNSVIWSNRYGVGGPGVIELTQYNECWGIKAMADGGAVMACGTGIEYCSQVTCPGGGTECEDRTRCEAGISDLRTGAVPKTSPQWSTLTIRVDAEGALLWQSVDAHRHSECTSSAPGGCETSSAGEGAVRCYLLLATCY